MRGSINLLRGSIVLTAGRTISYGLGFIRNLILARLLTKSDFGLAAVFSMAMMLLEVSGRMAFGTQIIQAPEGDSPRFLATAHTIQLIGGMLSAALIATFCEPMARLFGVPHAAWAFALLAVVPLSQGLGHLDVSRRQRHFDFIPLVLVDIVPQFLTTAAAWPLGLWFGDYRVIVWLMIAKAVISAAMTFFYARVPYRLAWESGAARSILSFGWPLILNGLIMFGSQQSDQMLVGAVFSMSVLANYATAFSLVSVPLFIMGQVLSSLMLPIMSRVQNEPERLRRQYRICAQIASVGGVLCLMPLIVAGEQIVVLFYGTKYCGTGIFIALLGTASALRFLRFAPTLVALATADTISQLYSNILRLASLPLAIVIWLMGGTPVQIASCAIAGEVLAIGASALRLRRRQGIELRNIIGASAYMGLLTSAGLGVAFIGGANFGLWLAGTLTIGALLSALISAWFMFPELTEYLCELLRKNVSKS